MANITLSIDPEIVKRVRRVAMDHDTTLTAMIRDYLCRIAATDEQGRQRALNDLEATFSECARNFGPRDWDRDGLYER